MIHVCVRIFDVTNTIENFLGAKHGLQCLHSILVLSIFSRDYISVSRIFREEYAMDIHSFRWAVAGARASGWSGMREKYCWLASGWNLVLERCERKILLGWRLLELSE